MSPLERYDYTFGSHTLRIEDIDWPATAAEAFALLTESYHRWREALDGITGEDLDQVGRSQNPYGSDLEDRFVDVIA